MITPYELPDHFESESYILGTLMQWSEGFEDLGRLDASDFGEPSHQYVFRAIAELAEEGKPYPVDAVHAKLVAEGLLESAGGAANLGRLLDNGVTSVTLPYHADIQRRAAALHRLDSLGRQIAKQSHAKGAMPSDIIEDTEREVVALQAQYNAEAEVSAGALVKASLAALEARQKAKAFVTGIPTGFDGLDGKLLGWQPSTLVILAARPAMGKTALALNMAMAAGRSGKRVGFWSLEMSNEELTGRLLCSEGRVDSHRFRSGQLAITDWERLANASNRITESKIKLMDGAALTVSELRARARKLHGKGELDMVFVDYLQLMQGNAESREREIAEISRGLKMLAKELNLPVVALSQLNRGVESRSDKKPTLSDLRDSGSIEQDADVVMFLYRAEVYDKDSADKGGAELIIAKHRAGPCGEVKMRFNGAFTRFDNV